MERMDVVTKGMGALLKTSNKPHRLRLIGHPVTSPCICLDVLIMQLRGFEVWGSRFDSLPKLCMQTCYQIYHQPSMQISGQAKRCESDVPGLRFMQWAVPSFSSSSSTLGSNFTSSTASTATLFVLPNLVRSVSTGNQSSAPCQAMWLIIGHRQRL